jgi:hypothetical protein
MLKAVLVVTAAVGAAVVSGVSAPAEHPDVPGTAVLDSGNLDRDDFTNLNDFDGGNGNGE